MTAFQLSDEQMEMLTVAVDEKDAHTVLSCFGEADALESGSFMQALVDAVSKADQHNRRRLMYGFPGLVAAVQLINGHPDGLARLRAIAGLPEAPTKELPHDVKTVAIEPTS